MDSISTPKCLRLGHFTLELLGSRNTLNAKNHHYFSLIQLSLIFVATLCVSACVSSLSGYVDDVQFCCVCTFWHCYDTDFCFWWRFSSQWVSSQQQEDSHMCVYVHFYHWDIFKNSLVLLHVLILYVPWGAISPPLLFNEVRCSLITGPSLSNEYHKQTHYARHH